MGENDREPSAREQWDRLLTRISDMVVKQKLHIVVITEQERDLLARALIGAPTHMTGHQYVAQSIRILRKLGYERGWHELRWIVDEAREARRRRTGKKPGKDEKNT